MYTGELDGLFQYDVTLIEDTIMFRTSKTKISDIYSDFISAFRMGPDRRIYILDRDYKISRINNPNQAASLCNFEANLIQLPNECFYLGTPVIVPNLIEIFHSVIDSTNCISNEIQVRGNKNWDNYLWSSGETSQTISVKESSTVWVTTKVDACRVNVDTFKVILPKLFSNLHDATVCNNQELTLDASAINANYLWQDGSLNPTFTTSKAGKYWVNITTDECNVTDTITVTDGNFSIDLGNDSTVCLEEEFKLQPKFSGNYLWQDGSDAKTYTVNETGVYSLKVTKDGCFATDSIFITKVKCNNCLSISNAFTPNDDSKNEVFRPIVSCPVLKYSFKIVNRYGQIVFETDNTANAWNGKLNNQDAEVGAYYYFIEAIFDKPNSSKEIYKGDLTLLR